MNNEYSPLRSVASIISVMLHPLIMPMYATYIIFNSRSYVGVVTNETIQHFIYLVVFISTYLLPAVTSWIMWKSGWIKNLEMENREERTYPFLSALICYAAGAYLLFILPVPRIFGIMVSGAALAIFWSLLVNLKWKISIHMIGIGGVMGLFFAYGFYFHSDMRVALLVFAVLAGILGTARLIKNAHVPSQIYAGFLGGFLLEFFYFRMIAHTLIH